MRTLYKNARILDPNSGLDLESGFVIVDHDGRISGIGNDEIEGFDDLEIDCYQCLLIPGLIDAHVHFREPGQIHKEDISSGSLAAAAGGITSVVCMPNTNPVVDNTLVLDGIYKSSRDSSAIRIFQKASITMGLKGDILTDMLSLREAGAIGFTDDGKPISNAFVMRETLRIAARHNLWISQHAECLDLSNHGSINCGYVSEKLGIGGIPTSSEVVCIARDVAILCDLQDHGMFPHLHIQHVSCAESVNMIRIAKSKGLNITCEVTPHHITLIDRDVLEYRSNAKMNPPLRSEKDRLALIEGLIDGTIDIIATDHAPHEREIKDFSLIQDAAFGIIGLETFLPLSLALYHNDTLSLREILRKITCDPANIIGKKDLGRLKIGGFADISLIDLDCEYEVCASQSFSKSRNSPFYGKQVKGKVLKTIVNGKCVYDAFDVEEKNT